MDHHQEESPPSMPAAAGLAAAHASGSSPTPAAAPTTSQAAEAELQALAGLEEQFRGKRPKNDSTGHAAAATDADLYEYQQQRPRRSSRRERYKGWPEELRKAHSLLRRMIRPVVGFRTPTDAEVEAAPNQLVLDLCRKHPMLATEKFLCHNKQVELSPLKFLIHNQADVEVITGFCQSFPHTVQQVDGKNDFFSSLDGYPLHMASTIRQNDGALIALLASAHPPAVSIPNEGGFLPLHLLLEYRGFTPALEGVRALIDIDPEAAIRKAPVNPPPVFSVLSSSQLSREHMECIYSRLPRHVIRLDFPPNCFHEDCLSLDHARTIARVLPQIQEINLQPPQWASEAWLFFVQACQQHATHLRKLALRPPVLRPGVPPEVRTAFFQFLYGCTALEMMDLQTSMTTPQRMGVIVPDLTAPIAHLLTHGRLVSLRVVGYNVVARPIFASMIRNTQLKHLIINGILPATTSNDTLTLSGVLEHHNTTLQQAQLGYSMIPMPAVEAAKIQYYTRLNRCGRAAAQHTTLTQMAQILVLAQMDPELRTNPRECSAILYGLLRESPGLWSQNAGANNKNNAAAAATRKRTR